MVNIKLAEPTRAVVVSALLFVFGSPFTSAGGQTSTPAKCISGFVWREAFSGDFVCVDTATRTQAATDNRLAATRRQPGGGASGPSTCRTPFVWREARPTDRVCVTQETRAQAATDNRLAESRRVLTPVVMGGSRAAKPATTGRMSAASHLVTGVHVAAVRTDSSSMRGRGFDDEGNPYVEDILPDGTKRRVQRGRVITIHPDGTSEVVPIPTAMSNTQAPTPPALPASQMPWVNYHNDQLLDLIATFVRHDARQLDLFHAGETKSVGADPFKQIAYRMQVLDDLSRP